MQTLVIRSSSDDPGPDPDSEQPFLEVAGVEGSTLRATLSGLVVRPCADSPSRAERHWDYDQLASLRIDAYGPIGVIRATIRTTGSDLPMLLLEPDQITAARRGLEMIWNLMASRIPSAQPA
jgi:hypothetical protein